MEKYILLTSFIIFSNKNEKLKSLVWPTWKANPRSTHSRWGH